MAVLHSFYCNIKIVDLDVKNQIKQKQFYGIDCHFISENKDKPLESVEIKIFSSH